ncbi:hypothetical protein EJ05DRAFT_528820 [Pseudovirgaria hyperparasitica]|uniref:Uncharacterized protein n=1 Tax=Pseudovirgaria hyperparasitica TaxID=470096 RepID=A0A6A6W6V6_9PEZI|nr:uncharacterized protein EJ05DRAFT_528820 [Pseudovirgaria hyperparasitica]KAF2758275.1 hypothetical protein EJ05DRAFT_528820 [Pseudovirgaria hyperparasitica]
MTYEEEGKVIIIPRARTHVGSERSNKLYSIGGWTRQARARKYIRAHRAHREVGRMVCGPGVDFQRGGEGRVWKKVLQFLPTGAQVERSHRQEEASDVMGGTRHGSGCMWRARPVHAVKVVRRWSHAGAWACVILVLQSAWLMKKEEGKEFDADACACAMRRDATANPPQLLAKKPTKVPPVSSLFFGGAGRQGILKGVEWTGFGWAFCGGADFNPKQRAADPAGLGASAPSAAAAAATPRRSHSTTPTLTLTHSPSGPAAVTSHPSTHPPATLRSSTSCRTTISTTNDYDHDHNRDNNSSNTFTITHIPHNPYRPASSLSRSVLQWRLCRTSST